MGFTDKPRLLSMNRGIPIYLDSVDKLLLPVFKCGYTSSHAAYSQYGKVLASFNDLIDYGGVEKIALVRNPYQRIVSLWTCQNNRENLHAMSRDFEHFVENVADLLSRGYQDGHYNSLVANLSIQEEFMPNTIVKMEDGLDKLVDYIGIPVEFPKKNVSNNKKPYTTYYTDKSRKMVEELYKEDLQVFDYAFGD